MAEMPVNQLLVSMGLPIILSMMMQAAYNIVDSIFIANIPEKGELAINALTLAFPVQMFMVAVGIGTGVGMNALLSKYLGMREQEQASFTAGNAFFLGFILYAFFFLFGIFGIEPYIASQTNNSEIFNMAVRYLRINCLVSMGIICFNIMEKLLQATGRSNYSTIAQISGAVTNIILDPVMIYGLWICPEMGIEGAAWATVIGQLVSAILGIYFHLTKNIEISNGLRYMKPKIQIIKGIYSIGLPAIIAQALMSVMTYGLNIILVQVSENAVTAYGLYYKIQQFILFAAFGLRDAITPIISFNYGMGNKKRVNAGIRYGIRYTLGIMLLGMILLELLAVSFSILFGLSGETKAIFISALRFISLSFLFAGFNVASQGIFQALNGGKESLIISLLRQLVFVLPLAYMFSLIARNNSEMIWLIWLSFVISEGITSLVAAVLMERIRKNRIDMI